MDNTLIWILLPAFLIALLLFFLLLSLSLRAKLRRIEGAMRQRWGDRIERADPCYLVVGYNRVPAMAVLLDDRIAWQATVIGEKGSLPFARLESHSFEQASRSDDMRLRKFGSRMALRLRAGSQELPILVMKKPIADAWRAGLRSR